MSGSEALHSGPSLRHFEAARKRDEKEGRVMLRELSGEQIQAKSTARLRAQRGTINQKMTEDEDKR